MLRKKNLIKENNSLRAHVDILSRRVLHLMDRLGEDEASRHGELYAQLQETQRIYAEEEAAWDADMAQLIDRLKELEATVLDLEAELAGYKANEVSTPTASDLS